MKTRILSVVVMGLLISPISAFAQDDQTLADVRQDLSFLFVEIQKLKRELSTTGGASGTAASGSVLDRVGAMESELQRLTAKTEQLENRINRVVSDGTNRIGDLEFRLVELEGGDISALGQTSTLGGGAQPAVAAPATPTPSTNTDTASLAVGEQADFQRAQEALASGDFRTASNLFATFNQTYPGGPLGPEADLRRGEALKGLGDEREAARAFLASFSAEPVGPLAPNALFELGRSLGKLGQTNEACVTLAEVGARFADSAFAGQAATERQSLGCI